MLSFQKLDVYRCSIQFVAIAAEIGGSVPRGHAELRDQLRRAALSVPLNIAEGAGRTSEADGARHFAIDGAPRWNVPLCSMSFTL
jgi:four helix bundle protein